MTNCVFARPDLFLPTRKAVAANPGNWQLLVERCGALTTAGNLAKAVEDARAIIRILPDSPYVSSGKASAGDRPLFD